MNSEALRQGSKLRSNRAFNSDALRRPAARGLLAQVAG